MKFKAKHQFFLSGAMTFILLLSALFAPAYTSKLVNFDNKSFLNTIEQLPDLMDREPVNQDVKIRETLSLIHKHHSGSIEIHNIHAELQFKLILAALISFTLHFFISIRLFRSLKKNNKEVSF
jgi:hypothetical protein